MGNRPPARDSASLFISSPVAAGVVRICIVGRDIGRYMGRARRIASKIAELYPQQYETWFKIGGDVDFHEFTRQKFDSVPFPVHLKGHDTSPFCWLECGEQAAIEPIGGCDHLCEWAKRTFAGNSEIVALCDEGITMSDLVHNGCSAWCFCFACCFSPFAPQTTSA